MTRPRPSFPPPPTLPRLLPLALAAALLLPRVRGGNFTALFLALGDVVAPAGRVRAVLSAVQPAAGGLAPPPLDYALANVFAAFALPDDAGGAGYEVFAQNGTDVLRFTTLDFRAWSAPLVAVSLPAAAGGGGGGGGGGAATTTWAAKSMARSPVTGVYLLAMYTPSTNRVDARTGELRDVAPGCYMLASSDPSRAGSFTPTSPGFAQPSFVDHDDVNLIWSAGRFVDLQIIFRADSQKPFCDNVGSGGRRSITSRVSADGGATWSPDASCEDPPACTRYNRSALIDANDFLADGVFDASLEVYRFRPFVYSGRLMAHAQLYAGVPTAVNAVPGYGLQPRFPGCQGGAKSGCCHGPHIYDELWVGADGMDATATTGWSRPFFDTPLAPTDVWLMAQPVATASAHVFVDDGGVWTVPLHRLAGLTSAGNSAFSTPPFTLAAATTAAAGGGDGFWLNADVSWGARAPWGGCDEGCQGYVMAELQVAATGAPVPGFSADACIIVNATGLRLPLVWPGAPAPPLGVPLALRFSFRHAVLYAAGFGS